MCGIAGFIFNTPQPADKVRQYCASLSTRLKHRGPDDEGFALITADGNCHLYRGENTLKEITIPDLAIAEGLFLGALVHRRLSIIAPGAGGHQPMQQNNHTLCYNGELYNFRETDTLLNFENHSGTDTETLLQLIQKQPETFLNHLEGFYAFACWNALQKTLYVGNDPHGVKPLFVAENEEGFFFASEAQALLPLTDNKIQYQWPAYLVEGQYRIAGNSPINAAENGTLKSFTFKNGHWVSKTSGRSAAGSTPFDADYFKKSIQKRLMSDVPIGFAMSGGLDSSLIAAQAFKLSSGQEPLHFFSVVSADPAFDESKWQQAMVEHCQAKWHKFNIMEGNIEDLQQFIRHQHLPPVAWNNIAHFKLCKMVHENGIKVMFNGQGADELFGGYPDYTERNFIRNFSLIFKYRQHLSNSYAGIAKGWLKHKIKSLMCKAGLYAVAEKTYLNTRNSDIKNYHPQHYKLASLSAEEKMKADFYGEKLGQMLFLEDLNGMAWSIESRNPFADDYNLAANQFRNLDFGTTLQSGYTKSALRTIGKGLLPEIINHRTDKKGFSVPDVQLTLKNRTALETWFFSDSLNALSSQKQRRQLLAKLHVNNPKEVQLFFRLSCLAMYYESEQLDA